MAKKKSEKKSPNRAAKNQHPPLKILQQKLQDQEFEVSYIAAGEEEIHFDSLLILLDEAEEEEESLYALQAFFVEDMMKAEDPELPEDETPDFATLQLIMELPVNWEDLSEDRVETALRLLNACSQKIPIGQFNLEGDEVYYTYALLADSQRIPSKVLSAALDLIGFFIPPMCAVLQEFADQEMALEACLEQLDQYILAEEDED